MSEQKPVEIVYRTGDARDGQRYGVASVEAAMEHHPDATIVSWSDGQPFEGPDAEAAYDAAFASFRAARVETDTPPGEGA